MVASKDTTKPPGKNLGRDPPGWPPNLHLPNMAFVCLVTCSTQDRKRASSASIIYAYIDLSAARNSKVSGLSKTKSVESARLNRHI